MARHYGVANWIAGYSADNVDDGYTSRASAESAATYKARQWRDDGWIVRGNAQTGYVAYPDREAMNSPYHLPTYIEVIELDYPVTESEGYY